MQGQEYLDRVVGADHLKEVEQMKYESNIRMGLCPERARESAQRFVRDIVHGYLCTKKVDQWISSKEADEFLAARAV